MTESELLARLSHTLRKEIGPALTEEYPKTQAFMAAVVTDKLSRQLASQQAHASQATRDMNALLNDLENDLRSIENAAVSNAYTQLRTECDPRALSEFIEALYANRESIDDEHFERLLARVRANLRADIDRRLEYSA